MKPLSFTAILILFAALPAAAKLKAGQRCDTAFLDKVAKEFTGIGSIADERIKKADRVVAGEMVTRGVLEAGDSKVCDAGTWRHLATGAPLVWRNADAGKYWDGGNAKQNAALLLIADDFFKALDPKVVDLLAAADEVIAAGVAIGVAVTAEPAKEHLDFLKANSGGSLAALTPKSVSLTVPDDKKGGTVAPDAVVATWQKLLDEKGATKSGGEAVLRFRQAVLALGADIARQSAANESVLRRAGVDVAGVRDFIPGLPSGIAAQNFDKAAAAQDTKYDAALASLTGKGELQLTDATPRADALLDRVDIGLRNLVAVRAAQVAQIVAAAKSKLNGKTITAIGVAARASSAAATVKDPLGQAAMKALAQTPEYMRLDAMYENVRAKPGTPENDALVRAIDRERKDMQAAALSATVEADAGGRKSVVYTQGERKAVLGSLVPPIDGAGGDRDRENAADIIAALIVDRAHAKASYKTLMAAIGGAGEPGQILPSDVTPEEKPVAAQVPAEIKPVKALSDGSIADWFRNDHERYAARQRAAAAELATANKRERDVIAEDLGDKLAASKLVYQRELAAAAALKGTAFDSKERIDAAREAARAAAEAQNAARERDIRAAAQARVDARVKAESTSNADIINAEADKVLTASFRRAIEVTVATLRGEYVTDDSSRQNKLIRDSKVGETSATLIGFINIWFNDNWPKAPETAANLKPAVTTCAAALGLGDKAASPSYRNPENPDTVADHCKVHSDLTKFVVAKKGTVK